MTRKQLLSCGILSSLFYVALNIFIPPLFEGYDWVSQTVSELSAIGAPTRQLWVPLAMVYILLLGAFACGVWLNAGNNRYLLRAGNILFVYAAFNIYWPPMHLRGNTPTLTDSLHIIWAIVTIVLMMVIMALGAAALDRRFRLYTGFTFVVFLVFGVLSAMGAPGIPKNLPTPNLGIWERVNIGAFMLWVMVFAYRLLRRSKT